jgi:hypothetical protein
MKIRFNGPRIYECWTFLFFSLSLYDSLGFVMHNIVTVDHFWQDTDGDETDL